MMSLVLSNNLLMSFVKSLTIEKESKSWLRAMLVVFSFLGVMAASALNGSPIDLNQLTDLGGMLVDILVVAVSSHFTYKAIKNA